VEKRLGDQKEGTKWDSNEKKNGTGTTHKKKSLNERRKIIEEKKTGLPSRGKTKKINQRMGIIQKQTRPRNPFEQTRAAAQ